MARKLSTKTKIKRYEKILIQLLEEWKDYLKNYADSHFYIIDKTNREYLFFENGWREKRYVHLVMFHLAIHESGKVLFRVNHTDKDIAGDLVEMGIDKADLVFLMQPEKVRPYTGFGVLSE
ncbi:MAG: element excision factor XisI family protein [Bacteroidia bacterium]